jgi:methionyl-tRNA formyltransferase
MADVVGVVCQPDKPAGRGLVLTPPAVKLRAMELGLEVVQPPSVRTAEFGGWVRACAAEVAVVVAYGKILPKEVLEATPLGCVNVHASLLPKYRGAAPIAWAIAGGETETGVTLMKLDQGMDTGPTFARTVTPIGPDETAGELAVRLAEIGAEALGEWLPKFVRGECRPEPQDDARASIAPMLQKIHGRIDWTRDAARVHDHVRAMNPWPGASTVARGRTVKVHGTCVVDTEGSEPRPGCVLLADKTRVLVACGSGVLELVAVQPEGKRTMRAADWAMGRGVGEGDILGG